MFKSVKVWFAAMMLLPMLAVEALSRVEIDVDLSSQRMNVTVEGKQFANWPISSGRKGYYTPRGTWRPKWLKRMHYSQKYDNAPMPWSIFYHGGYAIHGTNAISRLGRPASHGCIRLHPANAQKLFELVQKYGRKNTIIRVRGSTDVAYANLRKATPKKRLAQRKTKRYRNARKARRLAQLRRKRAAARRAAARRAAARRARAERRYRTPRYDFIQIYGAGILR